MCTRIYKYVAHTSRGEINNVFIVSVCSSVRFAVSESEEEKKKKTPYRDVKIGEQERSREAHGGVYNN